MQIDRRSVISAYIRLTELTKKYLFEAKLLNTALIKNRAALEDEAERLQAKRQEIIRSHAETYSETDDLPDSATPGDVKTQVRSGTQIPVFASESDRELAQSKLDDLFGGSVEVDVVTVPYEAMEIPDDETVDIWYPLQFMFESGGV